MRYLLGYIPLGKAPLRIHFPLQKMIRLPLIRISVTQIAVEREVFEDEENEVESDNQVVHNTNAFNQISQDGDPSGNYMHQNPKI